MPPIGETLREARVRQRIDVAQVETATKIRAKYLRALENEEFDRLPGSTFVRTFIRTYADYLGLDAHLLVEEYRVRHEPPAEEEAHHLAPAPAPARRRRSEGGYRPGGGGGGGGPQRSRVTGIAGAVIAIILLLLVIGLLTGGGDEGDQAGAPATTESDGPQGRNRGGGDGGGGGGGGSSQPDDVRLQVTPAEATYVCIDDGDGKRLFEGVLESPRSFRADTLLLNLGRSSARLEVNGKRVDVPQSSEAVGFELTPDGEQELAVGERPCT